MATITVNAAPQPATVFSQGSNHPRLTLFNVGTTIIWVDDSASVSPDSYPLYPQGTIIWEEGQPLYAVSSGPGAGRLSITPNGGYSATPIPPFGGQTSLTAAMVPAGSSPPLWPVQVTGTPVLTDLKPTFVGVFNQLIIGTNPFNGSDVEVSCAFYDGYNAATGQLGNLISSTDVVIENDCITVVDVQGPYVQVSIGEPNLGFADHINFTCNGTLTRRPVGSWNVLFWTQNLGYSVVSSVLGAANTICMTLPTCEGPTQFAIAAQAQALKTFNMIDAAGTAFYVLLGTGDTAIPVNGTLHFIASLPAGLVSIQAAGVVAGGTISLRGMLPVNKPSTPIG